MYIRMNIMNIKIYVFVMLFGQINALNTFAPVHKYVFNTGKVIAGGLLATKMGYDVGTNIYYAHKKQKTLKYLQQLLDYQQYDRMIRMVYGDRIKEVERQIEGRLEHELLMLKCSPQNSSNKAFFDQLINNKQSYDEWKKQIVAKEQERFCKQVIMPNYRYKYDTEAHKFTISIPATCLNVLFGMAGLDIVKDGIQRIMTR